MPPRLPLQPRLPHPWCLRLPRPQPIPPSRTYAAAAAVQSVLPSNASAPIATYPPTQPPSHRPPEFRKSQLLRQYASLLRSTPIFLVFQHNNLKSTEWVGIRRELTLALQKADPEQAFLVEGIKLQTIQTGIFAAALKVTEYFDPVKDKLATEEGTGLTHALSKTAHEYVVQKNLKSHPLAPLLSGPLAILTFPTVSPVHLAAALSILAPSMPKFPAPTRRANPGYHDAVVQNGLSKLLLLGARVEGRVFDADGAKWIGGIEGGMDGLRATLVGMLQSIPGGLVGALEGAGKSLWLTVEGRRTMLEEGEKKPDGDEGETKAEEK